MNTFEFISILIGIIAVVVISIISVYKVATKKLSISNGFFSWIKKVIDILWGVG